MRGNFRIVEVLPADRDDYYMLLTSFRIRNEALSELQYGPCSMPVFPAREDFAIETECEALIAGNALKRKVFFQRNGPFLHVFYITFEETAGKLVGALLPTLELNPDFCYTDGNC